MLRVEYDRNRDRALDPTPSSPDGLGGYCWAMAMGELEAAGFDTSDEIALSELIARSTSKARRILGDLRLPDIDPTAPLVSPVRFLMLSPAVMQVVREDYLPVDDEETSVS